MSRYLDAAQRAIDHCHQIATYSEVPGRITRTFLSAPMREVHQYLGRHLEAAGMATRVDNAGNLRATRGDSPKLAIGSHLDTVPNAGRYDGVLGVVMALTLAELVFHPLEAVGFSEEEGVRFGTPSIGSRAYIGDPLERDDINEAIREYGLDPRVTEPPSTKAYLEFHIEQGPVLESLGLPLGIVDSIAGQSRLDVTFLGQSNHAGTTPMALRHDALAAAAEWIRAVEAEARATPGLVATVGHIEAHPNVRNAINGSVLVSLDVRHADDRIRHDAVDRLIAKAKHRDLEIAMVTNLNQPAVPMDTRLTEALAAAVASTGRPVHRLTSGAGHDAMIVARRMPVAMLFLRSPGGISHHPDEAVLVEDVAAALEAGVEFLTILCLTPPSAAGTFRSASRTDALRRLCLNSRLEKRTSTRLACTFFRALSTSICISTNRAAPTGKAARRGAGRWPRAAAPRSLTCRSTPRLAPRMLMSSSARRKLSRASSITDFGLWGGLIPGNLDDMAPLAEAGVVGFKAFMSNSGLPEFPHSDDVTLLEGMAEAAKLGLPVAVHAESDEITRRLGQRMTGSGVRDFLASRPIIAELEAISRALLFAEETGVALHIVHISSGRGVALAAMARARGVNVSIETCPHYLFFTDEDVERIGVAAKCAPPIRDAREREALWTALNDGTIDIVASDHSPAPPERKAGSFVDAWGGIAGVQSTLAVLLERASLERIAEVLASKPAARFRIPHKGTIAVGNDADLMLVDLNETYELKHLYQRHPISPYLGHTFRGVVKRTIRRGETIFQHGEFTARTPGKLIKCNR